MNSVLNDWLGELLDNSDKPLSATTHTVEPTAVSCQPSPKPVPVIRTPAENTISPSPWATLQAQVQQAASVLSAGESTSRWLRLRCGSQTYAVELLKVQEVVLPLPLLALRGSEPALLGIMNLRGQVVPVLDLNLYLGGTPTQTDPHTRIVVLEENGHILGLRTDAVDDVAHLSAADIEAPKHISLCRNAHTLFCGMARIDEHATILLDAGQLLYGEP